MDEETKHLYADETIAIAKERVKYINRSYPVVRNAFKNKYDWPNMDILRNEVCLCLIFGLYQAAITLTNHLLESLLKESLIIHETKTKSEHHRPETQQATESFISLGKDGREKYGSADLGNNIDRACRVGFISKDQRNELHKIRDDFRNAYSHSDKDKTFGDQAVPIQHAHVKNGAFSVGESENVQLAEFMPTHGLAQLFKATNEAIPYFLKIDSLVRQIKEKLFNPTDNLPSKSKDT